MRTSHSGPTLRLDLIWSTTTSPAESYKVSARLLDRQGDIVAQQDAVPVHFAYPTTAWVPGERVRDVYDLPLPLGSRRDELSVVLIIYRAADGAEIGRLKL